MTSYRTRLLTWCINWRQNCIIRINLASANALQWMRLDCTWLQSVTLFKDSDRFICETKELLDPAMTVVVTAWLQVTYWPVTLLDLISADLDTLIGRSLVQVLTGRRSSVPISIVSSLCTTDHAFLMIAYIALFSALLSRLIALGCGSAWVTSFIARFFNIHLSGVLTALAWLVPHKTAAVSAQVLCTPYNHAPCHFMQSHMRKVYACLAVTCHLHFWQNNRDLLRATMVTRGWNGYRNKSQHRKSTLEKKFSRRSCRDSNPRHFDHESGALTTELSPPPWHLASKHTCLPASSFCVL